MARKKFKILKRKVFYLILSNIKANQKVKNYQELCRLLEEPVLGGCSKKRQVDQWKRYFDFYKEKGKQSFIIKEIYPFVVPESIHKHDIYAPYFLTIMTDLISRSEGNVFTTSWKNLYKCLGLVNVHFVSSTTKTSLLKEINDYYVLSAKQSKWLYNRFIQRTYKENKSLINDSFARLQSKGYIFYKQTFSYYMNDVRYTANEEEQKIYEQVEEDIKEKQGIHFLNLYNFSEFYSELDKTLEEKFGWQGTMRLVKVSFTPEYKQCVERSDKLTREQVEEAKRKVNENIVQRLKHLSQNEYDTPSEKITSENAITEKKYIEIQHKLIDTFVKI